jgi:hypothetical protein
VVDDVEETVKIFDVVEDEEDWVDDVVKTGDDDAVELELEIMELELLLELALEVFGQEVPVQDVETDAKI